MGKGNKRNSESAKEVTRAQVLAAIEALEAVVKEWEESKDENLIVYFRGRQVRQLSSAIEQSAMELFALCDVPTIERDAWPLVLAIDEFDAELSKFADRYGISPESTDPNGGNALWAAYGNMLKAKIPPRPHKIEPIPQLLAENVNRNLIAKIYGWYRPDGSPDLDKLQEEITTPGTHYDPSTFVHHKDKKFWDAIEEKWNSRVKAIEAGQRGDSNTRKAKRESPESLDELIMQGVNVDQIVKMKHVDAEDVRKRAAEIGIALDSGSVVYATYADAQRAMAGNRQAGLQGAMDKAIINTHPDLGDDRTARISAMHADGHTPRVIVDSLKAAFPSIQFQDVTFAIAKSMTAVPSGDGQSPAGAEAIAAI